MSKFKVGDRVRRTKVYYDPSGIQTGEIATVSAVEGNYIGLKEYPRVNERTPYCEDFFELVKPRALQVGDRVRVYGWDSEDGLWNGEIVTVRKAHDFCVDVSFGGEPAICVHAKQCRRLIKKVRK